MKTDSGYQDGKTGFSLIELMVAMTLGIFLVLGITTVVVNSSRSYGELSKASQQIENGRYATEILANDIRHAGFYGEFYRLPTAPTVLPDPCSTVLTDLEPAMSLAIQGYDFNIGSTAATPSPLSTCISNRVPGTDVLIIRRAATTTVPVNADSSSPTTLPILDANRVYLQTTATQMRLSTGSTSSTNFILTRPQNSDPTTWTGTPPRPLQIPALIRPFSVLIYFVRAWSATPGDGIPTLCRTELTAGTNRPAMTTVALVEGVENLQIEYGVDHLGGGSPTDDPSTPASADIYVTNPANTTAWANVMAIRLYVLIRSLEPTSGYQDTDKIYDLGIAGTVTGSGSFKRRVFSTVVRLNNSSMRREVPL